MSNAKTTHVKVARMEMSRSGKERILSLAEGGEAQLWEVKIWDRYLKFVNENPQVKNDERGMYPWTFVEYLNPPPFDIGQIVLLPEVTNGKEFEIVTNAKTK